jgi:GNAT superfamily N-acetyltransferase
MTQHSAVRRVLVIANETVEAAILHDTLVEQARATEVVIVAPALNSRVRHWTSDEDRARDSADQRLTACLAALDRAGVHVQGWVGDADPMRAIADALVLFHADEILIATHPEHRSNWLAHDLVARACGAFSLPIVHLVVEHAGARAELAGAAA